MAAHIIGGVTVRTDFVYPPIPIRDWDWAAIDADTYEGGDGENEPGGPVGRGATEALAIADLMAQLEERE